VREGEEEEEEEEGINNHHGGYRAIPVGAYAPRAGRFGKPEAFLTL